MESGLSRFFLITSPQQTGFVTDLGAGKVADLAPSVATAMTWCDNHAATWQVNKDYKKLKALLAQADMTW